MSFSKQIIGSSPIMTWGFCLGGGDLFEAAV